MSFIAKTSLLNNGLHRGICSDTRFPTMHMVMKLYLVVVIDIDSYNGICFKNLFSTEDNIHKIGNKSTSNRYVIN